MVKKLFKHEFIAWSRIMVVVYAVVLSLSVAMRLLFAVESDAVVYEIVCAISIILYVFALMACIFWCPVFGVNRFYKNLFTGGLCDQYHYVRPQPRIHGADLHPSDRGH